MFRTLSQAIISLQVKSRTWGS